MRVYLDLYMRLDNVNEPHIPYVSGVDARHWNGVSEAHAVTVVVRAVNRGLNILRRVVSRKNFFKYLSSQISPINSTKIK